MPPTWSSWPWVATRRVDAVGVLAQVREVGQHEVDAVHVGAGEHQPAVDEQDPAVVADALLDGHAVAADLPEPAEEDEPDGRQPRERPSAHGRRPGWRRPRRRASASHGGSAPIGGRQCPAGWPRWRSIALAGPGFGRLVAGLERPALEQPGVDGAGAGGVAGVPAVEQLDDVGRAPVGGHADQADGADGEQRQRQRVVAAVDLEVGRARRRSSRAVSAGLPAASLTPTMLSTSWARRASSAVETLRPVRTGMS